MGRPVPLYAAIIPEARRVQVRCHGCRKTRYAVTSIPVAHFAGAEPGTVYATCLNCGARDTQPAEWIYDEE